MMNWKHLVERGSHFVHQNFLWLLVGSYAAAAVLPAPGLFLRNVSLGEYDLPQEDTVVTLPMAMLALLLFNAGLGVRIAELRHLLRSPAALLAGLVANLAIPIAFIFLVTLGMRAWHNADEVQNILVGLALIASMPIAGSSTAWAQNANGDLALSLGMVLLSTVLSPATTPAALHAVGLMAQGDYASTLHDMAGYGTGAFLLLCVLLPSGLGILVHGAVGPNRVAPVKPALQLINSLNLLLLNYSNAAVSLPQAVRDPDWDFLTVTLTIVVALCALAFASGWLLARLLKTDPTQRAALMFGLGMNNNGTGLVLASMTMATHPAVMLPIIFYNLVQHLAAGVVDALLRIQGTPRDGPCSGMRTPVAAGWNSRRRPHANSARMESGCAAG
jgi:BASS family bile acid:Na+ symporter